MKLVLTDEEKEIIKDYIMYKIVPKPEKPDFCMNCQTEIDGCGPTCQKLQEWAVKEHAPREHFRKVFLESSKNGDLISLYDVNRCLIIPLTTAFENYRKLHSQFMQAVANFEDQIDRLPFTDEEKEKLKIEMEELI